MFIQNLRKIKNNPSLSRKTMSQNFNYSSGLNI